MSPSHRLSLFLGRRFARGRLAYSGVLVVAATIAALACTDTRPAATSAPADTTAGGVSFDLAGPGGAAVVVPVHIDGRGPFNLILDTGATLTCVDSSLANELALRERVGTIGAAIGVGGGGRVKIVTIDSLRVGEAQAKGLTACVMDLGALRAIGTEVRGLLGLNFLRNYRLTMDFPGRLLYLSEPERNGGS